MMTAERPKLDFPILVSVCALLVIGLASIYSATRNAEAEVVRGLFKSQLLWVFLGFILMAVTASLPFRFYYGFSYVIYGLVILLLLFIDFGAGHASKGALRWISVAGFKIQPSEYAKIGVLLALSRYLSDKPVNLERPKSLIMPCMLTLVPFGLVLKQPDLGTAMILSLMMLPLFFWAGMSLSEIFLLISPVISMILSFHVVPWGVYFLILGGILYFLRPMFGIAALVVAANIATAAVTAIAWNLLHDYQKARILTFLDPARDPFGSGYQVIQSQVAIGSGQFWGKGFLKGTQTKLSFLPEQHTDFIYSVFGEQFGFLGSLVLVAFFFILIYRGLLIAKETQNHFINLVCVGATSIIAFHIFINMAMTMGIMPVAGIPLPFLSYGGSFLSTCMILIGLLTFARRKAHEF